MGRFRGCGERRKRDEDGLRLRFARLMSLALMDVEEMRFRHAKAAVDIGLAKAQFM